MAPIKSTWPTFWRQGLPLANSPGRLSAAPLAEHVLMLILCFAKNLNHNRAAGWQRMIGEELAGKRLGLIGFGASAREVARRAWPLGMRIMAIDVVDFPQTELDEFHVEFLGGPEQLDSVLSQADYLSLHVHLNAATRHMIDRRALGLMKRNRDLAQRGARGAGRRGGPCGGAATGPNQRSRVGRVRAGAAAG